MPAGRKFLSFSFRKSSKRKHGSGDISAAASARPPLLPVSLSSLTFPALNPSLPLSPFSLSLLHTRAHKQQLYSDGQTNSDFNLKVLLKWFILALVHAALCFFLFAYAYLGKVVREGDDGLVPFGTAVLQVAATHGCIKALECALEYVASSYYRICYIIMLSSYESTRICCIILLSALAFKCVESSHMYTSLLPLECVESSCRGMLHRDRPTECQSIRLVRSPRS